MSRQWCRRRGDTIEEPLVWNQAYLDEALARKPAKGTCSGEDQTQAAILQLVSDGATWTNADLKRAIPSIISLSAGDRQRSPSRPREEKWEELVKCSNSAGSGQ